MKRFLLAITCIQQGKDAGALVNTHTIITTGVRPVISLKNGIKFLKGTGIDSDPFIVNQS